MNKRCVTMGVLISSFVVSVAMASSRIESRQEALKEILDQTPGQSEKEKKRVEQDKSSIHECSNDSRHNCRKEAIGKISQYCDLERGEDENHVKYYNRKFPGIKYHIYLFAADTIKYGKELAAIENEIIRLLGVPADTPTEDKKWIWHKLTNESAGKWAPGFAVNHRIVNNIRAKYVKSELMRFK